ncbi:MAG: DUF4974 domain-containing protein [Bacteroidia bacterium]|nr:DUF4974 domain-containing protein [Bacteroidia bacterium]
MDNDFNPIDNLLARFNAGEATREEAAEVKKWLNESTENATYFDNFKKIWDHAAINNTEQFDTEAAWNKVKAKTIDKPVLTFTRKPEKSEKAFLRQIGIAAGILLVISIGFALYRTSKQGHVNSVTVSATDFPINTLLPDSSTVFLGKNSKIMYPESFTNKTREVTLLGSGFFDIRKNPAKPFIIHAGPANIKVLGTSFMVRSVVDSIIEVTVKSGTIEVATQSDISVLKKGDIYIYFTRSGKINRSVVSTENIEAAQTHTLIFKQTKLSDVVADLQTYYNVTIVLENKDLGNCMLTSTFKNEKLEDVLNIISMTLNLKVDKQNNIVTLNGNSCK